MTSTLKVNTIEPAGNSLTLGASGDTVVIGNNDIRANTYKDAGGNTLWVSDGSGNLSSVNSALSGSLKLIQSQTASSSSSVTFTTGIDSTYKKYIFKFVNIKAATNGETFTFQTNASSQSGYIETLNSVYFRQYHQENDGGGAGLGIQSAAPSMYGNGTGYQALIYAIGNEADECGVGELHIYNPASTTFAKQWWARCNSHAVGANDLTYETMIAGYFNVTAALTQFEFKMTSGNIADGTIKLYGVS